MLILSFGIYRVKKETKNTFRELSERLRKVLMESGGRVALNQ